MNFLAHAYLSFADADILTGNMISDFVKGKKQYDYPAGIQTGINLHRAIDAFTDSHPAIRSMSKFFTETYRLYAAPITDVICDHLLAKDENEFSSPDVLSLFCNETYLHLDSSIHFFPEKFDSIYPYMRSQNWLYNYRSEDGLKKSLGGLHKRAAYMPEPAKAFEIFYEHQKEITAYYEAFFPDVKNFAACHLTALLQK